MLTKAYKGFDGFRVELSCLIQLICIFSDGLPSLTQARFDFVHYRSMQSEHTLVLALPLRITNADAIPPKL